VLRAVVLTQYRRVTDGIAIASTALAVRALRRVVKIGPNAKAAHGLTQTVSVAVAWSLCNVTVCSQLTAACSAVCRCQIMTD